MSAAALTTASILAGAVPKLICARHQAASTSSRACPKAASEVSSAARVPAQTGLSKPKSYTIFLWLRSDTTIPARINERVSRSEEHTSELQSRFEIVCRLLLEKKNN